MDRQNTYEIGGDVRTLEQQFLKFTNQGLLQLQELSRNRLQIVADSCPEGGSCNNDGEVDPEYINEKGGGRTEIPGYRYCTKCGTKQ